MDVQCIFVDPVTKRASLKLGSKILTGAPKLLQIVVLSLLNIPGKDALDPGQGGGFPAMIGGNFDPSDETELFSEVVRRVKKSQKDILESQVGLNIIPDEKLLELHVVSITGNPGGDSADVKLRLISESGRTQDVVL